MFCQCQYARWWLWGTLQERIFLSGLLTHHTWYHTPLQPSWKVKQSENTTQENAVVQGNFTGIHAAYGNHLLWRIVPLGTPAPSTNGDHGDGHAPELQSELPSLECGSVNIWPKLETGSPPPLEFGSALVSTAVIRTWGLWDIIPSVGTEEKGDKWSRYAERSTGGGREWSSEASGLVSELSPIPGLLQNPAYFLPLGFVRQTLILNIQAHRTLYLSRFLWNQFFASNQHYIKQELHVTFYS